ncbi:hypothetical protein ACFVSN_30865 [Kitasatospora sp. NPDC057904]|uniref:hypothetical protein n=1 Tax=Kitasatospora sp. NPDC057904 TaxID=3346275 RepID=UPI0036DDC67A
MIETLEQALRNRSAEGEAAELLVGTALNDDDADFVEHWCLQVGTRAVSGSPMLGLASLRLGHTARHFGRLSDEALALAQSLATRAEADPTDVDGRTVDRDGELLYIGITTHPVRRFREHAKTMPWWPEVDEGATAVEWLDCGMGHAEQAERAAVRAELPLFNKDGLPAQRNGRPWNPRFPPKVPPQPWTTDFETTADYRRAWFEWRAQLRGLRQGSPCEWACQLRSDELHAREAHVLESRAHLRRHRNSVTFCHSLVTHCPP